MAPGWHIAIVLSLNLANCLSRFRFLGVLNELKPKKGLCILHADVFVTVMQTMWHNRREIVQLQTLHTLVTWKGPERGMFWKRVSVWNE